MGVNSKYCPQNHFCMSIYTGGVILTNAEEHPIGNGGCDNGVSFDSFIIKNDILEKEAPFLPFFERLGHFALYLQIAYYCHNYTKNVHLSFVNNFVIKHTTYSHVEVYIYTPCRVKSLPHTSLCLLFPSICRI